MPKLTIPAAGLEDARQARPPRGGDALGPLRSADREAREAGLID
jgi:hypothetical protein